MEERYAVLNGVKSRYFVGGKADGHPIVLMHGWGCKASTLDSIARVAGESCMVVNVDFPGFGKSDEPEAVWSVDDYTAWLEALIEHLQISNPILLGHSFGGRVGILYSSTHIVNKLILVDAAGLKPRRSLKYYCKVYSFKLGKKLAQLALGKEKAQARIEKMRNKMGSSDYAGASAKMKMIMSRVVNQDLRHCLGAIKAPTLLIWGENDTATPLRDAKIMEKEIANAGLVSFPNCGHYSFLDNPYQFAAVLRSFLNS